MATDVSPATDAIEEEILGVTVTTIVDNQSAKPGLGSVHGLSLHIEVSYPGRSEAFLFDTSGSILVFRKNVKALDLNFLNLRGLVISHFHSDHVGALGGMLDLITTADVVGYLPAPHDKIEQILGRAGIQRIIADEPKMVRPGVSTTGSLGPKSLKEQALIVNSVANGLVLATGCSHPKVPRLMNQAKKVFPGRPIHAVIGGFHLKSAKQGTEVAEIFVKEGVKLVSPCHCTSNDAREAIRAIIGDAAYRENGSGTVISIQ